MMTTWPHVLGEYETIAMLAEGYSLARCGDGEAKLAAGSGYVREPPNTALALELQHILATPHERCLVGIPRLDRLSPKYQNWIRRQQMFLPYLMPGVPYVSALVTRPDSAPWICALEYAEQVQALWASKKVALICEPTNSLARVVPIAARKTVHILCPHAQAYAVIDDLERKALKGAPDVVILSCGPTATCLSHRLAVKGVQALDLGSIGGMLAQLLRIGHEVPMYTVAISHRELLDARAMRARLEEQGFTVHYGGEKD